MKEDRMMTLTGVLAAIMALLSFSVGKWIMGGVILLLAFGIFYNRGFGKFNDRSIFEKLIRTDLTIEELYDKIKDTETPLGKAWIAEHKGFKGKSIVFGPDIFKDCVVVSRRKGDIDVKHITLIDNIIRSEEDEYRFKDFIDPKEAEVTPKRYSIFVSFKLASVMLVKHLTELVEALDKDRSVTAPDKYDIFRFYYHNSTEGYFFDEEGNEILRVENSYHPFAARVLDSEGSEMASVKARAFNGKGIVIDSAGFDLFADGEHFGNITRSKVNGSDVFTVDTDSGEFLVKSFPACVRANVGCNYTIEKDGRQLAVIGGSPNILFDTVGRAQNDVILSYDDDYLVLYSIIEIFIMTLNKQFLK
ncbi:MAG: hypothetical protein IKE85_06865 [Mogibacterium sp.]|nr:hypothetical protein [Mogibacterium sp.]